jgi:hypothetical protein
LVGELGQHPNPFPLPEGTCGVVAKLALTDDGIQKAESLFVLDRNVIVPDDPEDFLSVVPDHCFPKRNIETVARSEGYEFYIVVESSGDDGFGGRRRVLEPLSQTMPRWPSLGIHH